MPELTGALAAATENGTSRIDLIAMDACNMAMLEVAYDISHFAGIMVASEEAVPGTGFRYDSILGNLASTPSQGASDLATTMVATYSSEYASTTEGFTISAIDLTKVSTLKDSVSQLADVLMQVQDKTLIDQVDTSMKPTAELVLRDDEFVDLYVLPGLIQLMVIHIPFCQLWPLT
jgi:hypothetical protein